MDQQTETPPETRYTNVASLIFDTPLLIDEGKLQTILRVLGPRAGFDVQVSRPPPEELRTPEAHRIEMAALRGERRREGHYIFGSVAVIPVIGTLMQRRDPWMESSGFTSYAKIENMLAAALEDRHVDSIMLEIDSPGGQVAGAFDLADHIFEARKQKHITASVNEFAASGGYLLASAASEIAITRTARAGSIGVVTSHIDYSKAMDKAGVAVTYIYAGDKKIDGNSAEPLPDRVKAEWQAEISSLYDLFVETVARNIGISPARVRATQAGMFTGRKAVDAGLATRVNTFNNELSNAYSRNVSGGARIAVPTETPTMETKPAAEAPKPETTAAAPAPVTPPTPSTPAVEAPKPAAAAVSTDAATVERERIKTIMSSPEADGRAELASHFAYNTSMSAADSIAALSKSPKSASAPAKSPLTAAIEASGSPRVSGSIESEPAAQRIEAPHEIYARRASATK